MEIHTCHEKLKAGLRAEEAKSGAHLLLDYYRKLSGSTVPKLKKIDTTFVDALDIVRVYSVQLDETFPLIEYPFRLFRFHMKNLSDTSDSDKANIQRVESLGTPAKCKDFMRIYSHLKVLSADTQQKLMIHSFFSE